MFQKINKFSYVLISAVIPNLLLVFLLVNCASGQYALVKKISAETSDGIRVTAWIKQQQVTLNQDVIIDYEVINSNGNTTYLVQKDGKIETFVDGDILEVPFSILFSGDSSDYHYSFTKIQRGKTHKGQIIIPAGRLNKEQTWLVEIGFGFVTNIEGLNRQLRIGDDPVPYREMLSERVKIIGINGLVVEVEEA